MNALTDIIQAVKKLSSELDIPPTEILVGGPAALVAHGITSTCKEVDLYLDQTSWSKLTRQKWPTLERGQFVIIVGELRIRALEINESGVRTGFLETLSKERLISQFKNVMDVDDPSDLILLKQYNNINEWSDPPTTISETIIESFWALENPSCQNSTLAGAMAPALGDGSTSRSG